MHTMHDTTDITRRQVARGAAWTVPVLAAAAAAPARAASPCSSTHLVSWNQYDSGVKPTKATATGATTVMSISSTNNFSPTPAPSNNLRVWNGPDGGFPATERYLEIALPAIDGPHTPFSQTVTFTFSAPVRNLSTTLVDIDSTTSAGVFQEEVYVTGAPFTFTKPAGSGVSGSGTEADPFLAADGVAVAPTSNLGNVGLHFVGPLTSFSVTLREPYPADSGSSGHSIDVFSLTFTGC